MEDGGQRMEDREWSIERGVQISEDRGWRMGDSEQSVENGGKRTESQEQITV
jgi:hypothetical protein